MKEKIDNISWERILSDINNTPIKNFTEVEQEWLGIYHSSQIIENTLNNYSDRYSVAKKEAMKQFLIDVKEMFEKFDAFYEAFLRRD